METTKKNVRVLETETLKLSIYGVKQDTKSQFKRENVYFVTFSDKHGTDYRNAIINEGVKIDCRSIYFETVKQIAENNATKCVSEHLVSSVTLQKVETDLGKSGWIMGNVSVTETKMEFVLNQMSKGISKEDALDMWELMQD